MEAGPEDVAVVALPMTHLALSAPTVGSSSTNRGGVFKEVKTNPASSLDGCEETQ
jgi:hypothetical protein